MFQRNTWEEAALLSEALKREMCGEYFSSFLCVCLLFKWKKSTRVLTEVSDVVAELTLKLRSN